VGAAIALADGVDARLAVGLWVVVAARSTAAIPYVRTQLYRARQGTNRRWPSDLAQVLALGTVALAWSLEALPFAPVAAVAAVAAFNVAAVRSTPRPAVVIGIQQMLFGIAVIAVTAIAVRGL